MPKKFKLFRLGDHKVRGFLDDDGAPWIIAADLAGPLELSDKGLQAAVRAVPAGHKQCFPAPLKPPKTGFRRASRAVLDDWPWSLSRLYRIVARSHAATKDGTYAFKFLEWLAGEVLPSLRKDGGYVVTRRARAITQGLPGWSEARQSGKVARRSLTDAVKDFVAYAQGQGSNNAKFYFKSFTALSYRLALGLDKPPAGGRDGLSVRELLRVEAVEDFLQQFIDEEREAGVPYKAAFAAVKARAEAVFLRRTAA